MAKQFLVCIDFQDGYPVTENTVFTTDEDHLERTIKVASNGNPHATICVYALTEMRKISKPAEYQCYKFQNGEVVPK